MSAELIRPDFALPVRGPAYARPDAALVEDFSALSSATACAKLHQLGIRRTFVDGPVPLTTGSRVVGSAITLQFMPQREDMALPQDAAAGVEQEYAERHTALWHVLEAVQPGDVLVVQAYGSRFSGCLGDILVRDVEAVVLPAGALSVSLLGTCLITGLSTQNAKVKPKDGIRRLRLPQTLVKFERPVRIARPPVSVGECQLNVWIVPRSL